MKNKGKILLLCALALTVGQKLCGWGNTGHRIVAELAIRQLTPKTRAYLLQLLPGGIADEASWADQHRHDEEYAFTDAYHIMAMNHDYAYDPGWRMWRGGDCVTGLYFIDYNLANKARLSLTDSVKVFNIRMLVHILGDMHCLGHAYVMPEENHWDCTFGGETTTYHIVVDKAPNRIFENMTPAAVAESLDTLSEEEIAAHCSGSFEDWAQECCMRDKTLYDINSLYTAELASDTMEKISPAVREALQVSGYRLGYLLNKYFND